MATSTAKLDEKLSQIEAQKQRLENERLALLQKQAEAEETARQTRVAAATIEVRASLNEAFNRMRKANERMQKVLAEAKEALKESDRLTQDYQGNYSRARTKLVQANATSKEILDAINELEPSKISNSAIIELHRDMNYEWLHNIRKIEKQLEFGQLSKVRHLILVLDRGF